MPARPLCHRPLAVLIASMLVLVAAPTVAATAQTGATATSDAASGSAPAATTTTTQSARPKLTLTWTLLTRRCSTTSVKSKGKKTISKRQQTCDERPVRAHGRALHLHWRQKGELFGRLTLDGQPVPNATVYIQSTIRGWSKATTTAVTNVRGRFSAIISGPSMAVKVTYSPGPGTYSQVDKNIQATAYLSLKVGHLAAGHSGHFSGIVFGGRIPQDLYIQFWYYAGPAGWQPFSHLAIVHRHNGHWSTEIPIPRASRGYRYEIKATVVPSPDWPWSRTDSRIVTRVVS